MTDRWRALRAVAAGALAWVTVAAGAGGAEWQIVCAPGVPGGTVCRVTPAPSAGWGRS
jgi:hypothetical protein